MLAVLSSVLFQAHHTMSWGLEGAEETRRHPFLMTRPPLRVSSPSTPLFSPETAAYQG